MNTKKIKSAMLEAGYSQRSLAKEMNMSLNALNAKINGKRRVYVDEAYSLCMLLDIPREKMEEIFLPEVSLNGDNRNKQTPPRG